MFGFGTRFRDYIIAKDGRVFCVDTVETFDCGWETMVGELENYEQYNKEIQEWTEDEELNDDEIADILDDITFDFSWDVFDMTKHYRSEESAEKGHNKTIKKLKKMVG